MLGDDEIILPGSDDELLESMIRAEFSEPLTNGLEDSGNGHADVETEVENPTID